MKIESELVIFQRSKDHEAAVEAAGLPIKVEEAIAKEEDEEVLVIKVTIGDHVYELSEEGLDELVRVLEAIQEMPR